MNKILSRIAIAIASFAMVIGGVSTVAILNSKEQIKPAYADPTETLTISGPHSIRAGEIANYEAIASGFTPDAYSYSWSHTNEYAASIIATEGNTATIDGLHFGRTYLTVSAEGPNGTVTSNSFWIDVQEFEVMLQEDEVDMLPSMSMRFEVFTYDENGDVIFEVNSANENAATAEIVSNSGDYLVVTAGSIEGISTTITINAKDNNGEAGYHTSSCSLTVNVGECYEIGDRVLQLPDDELLVFIANNDKTKFAYVENIYHSPRLRATNDITQASLFYLNYSACLGFAFYTFQGQTNYVGSDGRLATTSYPAFDEYFSYPDDVLYQDYPGILSYHGTYLGIENYGTNRYISSSSSNKLSSPSHYDPLFAYVAVSHGHKITLDETSVDISEGGSTDITATVAFVTDLDYEIISGAACIDDVSISSINNLNQAEIHIETSNVTGDAIIRIKDANDDSVYTDITVRVKMDAETEVANLSTQTSLAYHYSKDELGNFTYSNASIRFGARIDKDLWNEIDEDYDIAGFGVMITGKPTNSLIPEQAYLIKQHVDEAVSAESATDLDTELVDHYMSISEMAVPPESNNDYAWNLMQAVTINNVVDVTKEYTAAAYIKLLSGEYIFFDQVRTSVYNLASSYLNSDEYDSDTAEGSLQHLVDMVGIA